jgi:hypothetical protein
MNSLPDEKRPPGGTEAAVGEAKVSGDPILNIIIPPPAQDDYSHFSFLRLPELGQITVGHSDLG